MLSAVDEHVADRQDPEGWEGAQNRDKHMRRADESDQDDGQGRRAEEDTNALANKSSTLLLSLDERGLARKLSFRFVVCCQHSLTRLAAEGEGGDSSAHNSSVVPSGVRRGWLSRALDDAPPGGAIEKP